MVCRRYVFLIFGLIAFIGVNISFGREVADSLKILAETQKGEEQLKTLELLADFYLNSNIDSSLLYSTRLAKEAVKQENLKYVASAQTSIGLTAFYKGNYFEAEEYLQKAIGIQKQIGDTTGLAHSFNVLAGVYGESGQYSESVKILFEAISIYEARHNTKGLITANNNLGYLHMKMEDYPAAINHYQKALTLISEIGLDYNRGFSYSNLGICYKETGNYDLAMDYYRKAINEFRGHNSPNALPTVYQSIGNLFGFHLNQPDSALHYFTRGIELANELDPHFTVELFYSLGKLYALGKNWEKSAVAFSQSLEKAEKYADIDGQMLAHFEIYQLNATRSKPDSAIFHLEKYVELKDSIDLRETRTSMARLVEKYENDKNKLLIAQMKEKQLADQRLKIAMGSSIGLLLLALGFIVYALFQRRKRNRLAQALLIADKQKTEEELQFKNKQLASQSLMMLQKNNMLQELFLVTKEAENKPLEKMPEIVSKLRHNITKSIHSEKDWDLFKLYFEQVNGQFFQHLLKMNPELTQNDLRLAALIKLRFNIKEAAAVLNLAPNSIKGARSRLRSKLKLDQTHDLANFIENIE